MGCYFACRERYTWKKFFKDLFRLYDWRARYDLKHYAYTDLIRNPIAYRICKIIGHVPYYVEPDNPDCNVVACKRCHRFLDR